MKKLALLVTLAPSAALAHVDHSHEALTAEHMATSPFHVGMIAAALIGVGLVAVFLWREARAEQARSGGK